MSQFAQMDIFFIVTTLAVLAVTLLVSIGLIYVIRILRNVEQISEDVEGGTKSVKNAVVRLFKKRR
jgi:hypothetical protein